MTIPAAAPRTASKASAGVLGRIGSVAVTVILAAVLAVFAATTVYPALTGRLTMTVLTGSMEPALPPGYIVVYAVVDPGTLKPGDVIAYRPEPDTTGGVPITHRVVSIDSPRGIIVQGDAVPLPDAPVRADQVVGKMEYFIPYAGYLKVLIYRLGGLGILPLVVGSLFAYWIWLCTSSLIDMVRKALARRVTTG
ncbi:signal peptidase I [Pseudarthrobacter sp. BIM B-2242]|uniref:signal peptidase I n=1 Tax=Pseudarthrobacter sp. BIM B-2242 TaxID=2772401 RepID=UPI00168A837A|nr:signal peptidase I [Pseudarthrobacter sp. BIM B-2242]QOD06059.1 signal peptidase I [Pseudarthrobacter sp. BIM B-2242]